MRMLQSKKGLGEGMIIFLIVGGLVLFFSGTAAIKWIMLDKTPLIIGGLLLFLIILRQKRNG
jgi:hypothetical protein